MKIKKLCYFITLFMLTGCTVMPGMNNPDTAKMNKVAYPNKIQMQPTLIPITTGLITDQKIARYIYHIAPSDVLNINVWDHPEFSPSNLQFSPTTNLPSTQGAAGQAGYLVNAEGYIYFPLIGYVKVANQTVDEVRNEITLKLKKYIINPQINVRVVDFRSRKVYVLGEVKHPTFVPLDDQPLSLTDAIVLTGGLDPNAADPSHIYVIRGSIYKPDVFWLDAKTPEAMLLAEHFHLNPGDIIYVSSAPATRWNRVMNQLLPTIQTIWYTKAIVDAN